MAGRIGAIDQQRRISPLGMLRLGSSCQAASSQTRCGANDNLFRSTDRSRRLIANLSEVQSGLFRALATELIKTMELYSKRLSGLVLDGSFCGCDSVFAALVQELSLEYALRPESPNLENCEIWTSGMAQGCLEEQDHGGPASGISLPEAFRDTLLGRGFNVGDRGLNWGMAWNCESSEWESHVVARWFDAGLEGQTVAVTGRNGKEDQV